MSEPHTHTQIYNYIYIIVYQPFANVTAARRPQPRNGWAPAASIPVGRRRRRRQRRKERSALENKRGENRGIIGMCV